MKSAFPKLKSSQSAKKVEILDSTLRERTFDVFIPVGEKLAIASQLDSLGVAFVESLSPRDNPNEIEYLKQLGTVLKRGTEAVLFLVHSRSSGATAADDIPEGVKHVSIRVNCWQSHLAEEFTHKKIDPEENLRQIKREVTSLRQSGRDVFIYASHFFDGFFEDTSYALSVVEATVDAGASRIVLADSRGVAFPEQISKAVKLVQNHFEDRPVTLGIHAHNDLGLAVANTLAAVQAGVHHVQGTVNGLGERSGNADLCQLLPILILRLGYDALNSPLPKDQQLVALKALSNKVAQASGLTMPMQPFVGDRAFSHSDPFHVADVSSNPESYEVINPALVGNSRRLGVDDASLILGEMWSLGLYTKEREEVARKVLVRMHEQEAAGYKFDDAKASVHLLILETLGVAIWPFQVTRWETSTIRTLEKSPEVNGTIEVSIGENGKKVIGSAKGVGPIHAIDQALRRCLEEEFPSLKSLKMTSYSLNIVDSLNGTAASARARTEFVDQDTGYSTAQPPMTWATTAVSEDVVDASIRSLIDGYRYKLIFRSGEQKYALPDWKVALSWRYSEK
jgi:2-isopropylmalate synthase